MWNTGDTQITTIPYYTREVTCLINGLLIEEITNL
jgi:hypothetical protein